MFRKVLGSISFAVLTVSFFAVTVTAQTAAVAGIVELKTAENKVVPVEGAVVEVYRTDTKSGGPSDKTDKKGNFSFAGILLGGTYVLAVSAPGAAPSYFPNIKPGQGSDNIKILLEPGDGRKLTADEVRQLVAMSSGGGSVTGGKMSEEDKKAEEERKKEVARIEEKNKKTLATNAIIDASVKAGKEAFDAKNWDLAIAKFDEGYNASPDYMGSAPVLLNNKGVALRQRAVAEYNANYKNADASAKLASMAKVKADLKLAVESHNKAVEILNTGNVADLKDPSHKTNELKNSLNQASEAFRLMIRTDQVDEAALPIAKTLIPEYVAVETDATRKNEGKLILGDLYRVAGDAENAIAEYRKALETSPDNLDAMAGLGLSLVNAGFLSGNKEQLQDGANMLEKFANSAPDSHKFKGDVAETIKILKAENITPQKVAPTKRRGN